MVKTLIDFLNSLITTYRTEYVSVDMSVNLVGDSFMSENVVELNCY